MDAAARALADALADGDTLFLVHRNADPDAVGSAVGLARAFGGTIGAPGGVSASGRRLAARVGAELLPLVHPSRYGRVVAVDTSTHAQLGDAARHVRPEDVLVVDHHAYGDLAGRARLAVVDATRPSCAEVALRVIDAGARAPDADGALALAAGLVADTQRFLRADADTFHAFLRLSAAHGFTMADVVAALEEDAPEEGEDLPRRIAALKAGSRLAFEEHHGFLLVESAVSSFEANAARGLVRLGADLAMVAAVRSREARVSLRGSAALAGAGVNLGHVANAVAREVGWAGGGHAGAAGLNGTPPVAPVFRALKDAVVARLAAPEGGA